CRGGSTAQKRPRPSKFSPTIRVIDHPPTQRYSINVGKRPLEMTMRKLKRGRRWSDGEATDGRNKSTRVAYETTRVSRSCAPTRHMTTLAFRLGCESISERHILRVSIRPMIGQAATQEHYTGFSAGC